MQRNTKNGGKTVCERRCSILPGRRRASFLCGRVDDEIFAKGSTESVLTSFSCSTQSRIEFISFSKSLASSSERLILASLAILFIVFVSNFNLYVSSD